MQSPALQPEVNPSPPNILPIKGVYSCYLMQSGSKHLNEQQLAQLTVIPYVYNLTSSLYWDLDPWRSGSTLEGRWVVLDL